MRKFSMSRCLGLIAAGLLLVGGAAADTIPAGQTYVPAWHSAGLSLGDVPNPRLIVNVRDFGALGNGASNDYAAFNAAITSLNFKAGVVFVPAGNYYLRSPLTMRSGVILRGQSSTNTTLTFSTNFVSQCINISGSAFGAFQFVQSGATRMSSQVTVTNPSVFTVGKYVSLRMYKPGSWGLSDWGTNNIGQIGKVTAITGAVLTLDQPLRLDYSPYEPQIAPLNNPMTNAGIETLRITRDFSSATSTETTRNNVFTIRIAYAADCWVRGADLYKCFGAHIGLEYATHNEFRGNYFQEAHEYDGGGSGYGIRCEFYSCENLVENNVFRKLRHSMLNQIGANANVFGYNYSREGRDSWGLQTSDITTHGNYPFANLAEGNIVSFISLDDSHGWNGPYNTFFRNKATHSYGISDEGTCRNEAFVGNETASAFDPTTSRAFIYGNTKSSGFVAATSQAWSNLWDYSYYLSADPMTAPPRPGWWTIPQGHLSPIGPTNSANNYSTAKYIPAKSRYDAGGPMTFAPPSIERMPPESVLAYSGSTVVLSALAHGSPSVSYAWFKEGIPIPGATATNLVLAGVSAADQGRYTVSFTDAGGSITSPPTVVYLFSGTLTWTNDHGFLDEAGGWDPPAGPPSAGHTGLIASAGGSIEAVFRSALAPSPAELVVGAGGELALAASLTVSQGLTLDGGLLRALPGAVAVAGAVALKADSTVGSAGPVLSLKWTLADHADGAGKLIVSNSNGGVVAVYSTNGTYSGGTEVRAGDMLVYSNYATGTGPVEVMPGGLLKPALAILIQTNPVVLRGGRLVPHVSSAFKAPIQMRADSLVGSTNAYYVSLYGPITDHADGAGLLIVSNSGAGDVRFYSVNSTYSGGTEVQRGNLLVYSNAALGTGPVAVLPEATVQSGATTVQAAPLVLKGGRYYTAANYNLTAPIEVWSESYLDSTGASTAVLAGPIRDFDGTHTGILIKKGTGYLGLGGGATLFSGGLDVREGTLGCTVGGGLGSGAVTVRADAVLYLNGSSNASHGAGGITVFSNAIAQLNASYSANIVIRPGGRVRGVAAGNRSTYDAIRLEGDGLIQRQSGSGYVYFRGPFSDGAMPGRFVLATTNPFPVYLLATNLYTGGTWLTDGGTGRVGELILGAGGSLPDVGPVTLESNAVFNLNGVSDTIGSLEGAGEIKFGTAAATRLTVADDRETVFWGRITGTGGLVRAGSGALTLAGSNLWAGVTIVTGGLLRVSGELANSGPVTVYSNGFIGGSGLIASPLVIRPGGGLDWRDQPGALTVVTNGTFFWGTNCLFRYRFAAGTGSSLVVRGTLHLPAAARVEPLPLGGHRPAGPFDAVLMRADALAGAANLAGWRVEGARGYTVFRTVTEVVLRYRPGGLLILVR